MRIFIFFGIFTVVMAALNFYIYRRFFKRLSPRIVRHAAVVPVILMAGDLFFIIEAAFGIIPGTPAVFFITSAFVGLTFMLFVVATFYDLLLSVSNRIPYNSERRKFIKIIFDVTMLIAAMSYVLRGFAQGIKPPDVNSVNIRLKNFPFETFTLVQLSDLHIGRTLRREFIEDLVRRSNELAPDLVVITGDLIDLPIEDIRDDLAPLADLRAPVYFITGNHEYFHGVEAAIEYLRSQGIKPLLNECVVIGEGERRFNLVGINDLMGERLGVLAPDFVQPFACSDSALPTIVLSHQPKSILRMEAARFDLMLSGHTHGGQIFPFGMFVMMDQPYLAGLYQHDAHKQIFVSRGTGYWGPPLRVMAPSEITHLLISPA
jgi:predicted MPP superfamily phosphohydrolase